jgi:hypothetical protein
VGLAVDKIDRLIAIEEIKNLKARYFRYVDTQDWDAFEQIFTEDVRVQIDTRFYEGREDWIKHVAGFLSGGVSFHHGHMPEIEILSADQATGVWTLFDRVEPLPETSRSAFSGYGRYWEQYRHQADGWRISSLRLERLRLTEDSSAGLM